MKDNKLIAEFMELEASPKYNPKEYYVKEYNSGEWYLPEEMQYLTSWDWLMPVVSACKDHQIFGTQNIIDDIDNALICGEKESVFCKVVTFIKSYNEHHA